MYIAQRIYISIYQTAIKNDDIVYDVDNAHNFNIPINH